MIVCWSRNSKVLADSRPPIQKAGESSGAAVRETKLRFGVFGEVMASGGGARIYLLLTLAIFDVISSVFPFVHFPTALKPERTSDLTADKNALKEGLLHAPLPMG